MSAAAGEPVPKPGDGPIREETVTSPTGAGTNEKAPILGSFSESREPLRFSARPEILTKPAERHLSLVGDLSPSETASRIGAPRPGIVPRTMPGIPGEAETVEIAAVIADVAPAIIMPATTVARTATEMAPIAVPGKSGPADPSVGTGPDLAHPTDASSNEAPTDSKPVDKIPMPDASANTKPASASPETESASSTSRKKTRLRNFVLVGFIIGVVAAAILIIGLPGDAISGQWVAFGYLAAFCGIVCGLLGALTAVLTDRKGVRR